MKASSRWFVGLILLFAALLSSSTGCTLFRSSGPVATEPVVNPSKAAGDSTAVDGSAGIHVKLTDEERDRLTAQSKADLAIAQAAIEQQPDPSTLVADEVQKWDTLKRYVELAQAFLQDDDVRAAADLALKAKLLAQEVVND